METEKNGTTHNETSLPKTVRLDSEVMSTLADNREGFETPNDCLKRLLESRGCGIESKQKPEITKVGDRDVRS